MGAYIVIRRGFTLSVNRRHAPAVKIKPGESGALLSRTATSVRPPVAAATSTQLACPLLWLLLRHRAPARSVLLISLAPPQRDG